MMMKSKADAVSVVERAHPRLLRMFRYLRHFSANLENSHSRRRRTSSPGDLRLSTSDYGELGASATSSGFPPRTDGSPDVRRRQRGASESGKRPVSALVTLIDKVVPRRGSFSQSPILPDDIWNSNTAYARDARLLFRRRITNLYNTAMALKAYVDLNYSGFRKILKKYDKVLDSSVRIRIFRI